MKRPLPPDHDEFVAWHQAHRLQVWKVFNAFLKESPYGIREPGDEQEGDWAPTRIRRDFARWLGRKFPRKKDRRLRDFTKRGMHHELKPRKFYAKEK